MIPNTNRHQGAMIPSDTSMHSTVMNIALISPAIPCIHCPPVATCNGEMKLSLGDEIIYLHQRQ